MPTATTARTDGCALGPKFCTREVCECQPGALNVSTTKGPDYDKRGSPRQRVGVVARRGGKRLFADMRAWKAHWQTCAGQAAVERSGVCQMPEYACRCPNCSRMAEIIVRAQALRGEYAVCGETLEYQESLLNADPVARAAGASSPWAAPLDLLVRRDDISAEELTTIDGWLDSKPIRWQVARTTEYPRGDQHHDGPCRDQESKRRPEGTRSVA